MEIKLICRGQEIFRDPEDGQELVAGSRGILTARITYEDETLWRGLGRIVLWSSGSTCVGTVEAADGSVVVPWEALRPGELRVSVVGVGDGGKRRLVTKEMEQPLVVFPCGAEEETAEGREPTPAVTEVLTAMVAQALAQLDGVEAALADARAAADEAQSARDAALAALEAMREMSRPQEDAGEAETGREAASDPQGVQEYPPEQGGQEEALNAGTDGEA